MTLAVGTTLKNGTYVIDAWLAEDTIGPLYLAMEVPTGQWVQLRVLGSRAPQALPDAPARQAFYQYLEQVAELNNPALPTRLGGFEEEGVCYQVLSIPPGAPLDRLVTATTPLPPRSSLDLISRLAKAFQALHPLGWAGLTLTPDQVWYDTEAHTAAFTGFDVATLPGEPTAPAPAAPPEAALVRGLSDLIYFLLTGQRAEATKAPLAVEVRRHHPSLPMGLDRALEQGHPPDQTWPTIALADWVALLPAAADLPADPRPQATQRPVAPVTGPATVVVGRDRPAQTDLGTTSDWPKPPPVAKQPLGSALALLLTGLIATFSGLGVGLYARLQPASSVSPERLNPGQSFPPLPNWNSNTIRQPWADTPTRRTRPDYGDRPPGVAPAQDFTPNPQEPAAPPPAVPQPAPAPAPDLPPAESIPPLADPRVAPEPVLSPEPAAVEPAPAPVAPPAPLDLPLNPSGEGAAPPPLTAPPMPNAPAPTSS